MPSDADTSRTHLDGRIEKSYVSGSGAVLVIGWMDDEGTGKSEWSIEAVQNRLGFAPQAVLRHRRVDVEEALRPGPFDYGFVALAAAEERTQLDGPLTFAVRTSGTDFNATMTPTLVSDERFLHLALEVIEACHSHRGREAVIYDFFIAGGGQIAADLFKRLVADSLQNVFIEHFRSATAKPTFVTVLYGSTEPLKLQPLLFKKAGIDFGAWIYVCNSPELTEECLRLAKVTSELYDLPISVVGMSSNVGFGAANNVAVSLAKSDKIVLINPDIYPLDNHCPDFAGVFDAAGDSDLLGGLLHYDEVNLMHGGMHIEADVFAYRRGFYDSSDGPAKRSLLRVEHFDKGVPFDPSRWTEPKRVEAITGALMAFRKESFLTVGGFSDDYIFGHYEDADLSYRWTDRFAKPLIDPRLRLVHLEGQGSSSRAAYSRGAMLHNRCLFTVRHSNRLKSG